MSIKQRGLQYLALSDKLQDGRIDESTNGAYHDHVYVIVSTMQIVNLYSTMWMLNQTCMLR